VDVIRDQTRPGIVVVDHLSGRRERVRHEVSAIPPIGFAGQQGRGRHAHQGFYATAEIANAITAD
jgi:hypothetical protein